MHSGMIEAVDTIQYYVEQDGTDIPPDRHNSILAIRPVRCLLLVYFRFVQWIIGWHRTHRLPSTISRQVGLEEEPREQHEITEVHRYRQLDVER